MLTDYTTYASIRATLGVSTDDLTDETLSLDLYDDYLTQDLEDIAITLPDTYATTKAVSVPTALEIRLSLIHICAGPKQEARDQVAVAGRCSGRSSAP